MAEEDPNFKALLDVEWPQPFDFYEELRKLNNPEEKLISHKEKKMINYGIPYKGSKNNCCQSY